MNRGAYSLLTRLLASCHTDTFRIPLPPDLPPSYAGRAISFTYTLTLGTNRIDRSRSATSARSASGASGQKSRLIRIPFRVYNHVSVTGAPAFFDLGNPVVKTKDEAVVREESEVQDWTGGLKRRNSGKTGLGERGPTNATKKESGEYATLGRCASPQLTLRPTHSRSALRVRVVRAPAALLVRRLERARLRL